MINHTGTEIRSRLSFWPAVGNIGQWTKVWSPAAAVKREGQALFIMTGRKESVDCKVSYLLKVKAQL